MYKVKLYSPNEASMAGVVMAVLAVTSPNGDFRVAEYGVGMVPTSEGVIVYVEDSIVDELADNFKIQMNSMFQPEIVLKDGVNWTPPVDNSLEAQAIELERQAQKLREEQYKKDVGIAPPEDEEEALRLIDEDIASR